MSDYGELYENRLFAALYPDFKEKQQQAADDIWRRILGRCGRDFGMPVIEWIVDLGCGEGTLTRALADHAKRANSAQSRAIRILGVDCSDKAIKLAQKKTKRIRNLEFVCSNDPLPVLFDRLKTKSSIVWERTALVCLGHTWFHLDQTEILAAVKTFRPAVCLIDVFHSWDDTVGALSSGRATQVMEFARPIGAKTYWLRTVKSPHSATTVQRGIWVVSAQGQNKGTWFKPPTEQQMCSTPSLFGTTKVSAKDIFKASRNQGEITGESGCDYLHRRLLRHSSGWGEMLCHALVARDSLGVDLNKAHYEVVRSIVRQLFIDDTTRGRFANLRELLALYDEPKQWQTKKRRSGSREAVIVLPYDQHTTFARVVSLFPNIDDGRISRHDLIVEVPRIEQSRFPTAYGIFHTQEDHTSSPQGFPLHWATDYDHLPIDKAFDRLETELLGIWSRKGGQTVSFLDKSAPSYFLLPIYFGSLPLFTLALKFPHLFNPESTDFNVFLATLTNLHAEIKIVFSDAYVRSEILRPWMCTALAAVQHADKKLLQARTLDQSLDELEMRIFGISQRSGEIKENTTLYRVGSEIRSGGVLGKDWKSWVLTIPSYPIKRLRVVEAENARLWQIWAEEKRLLQLDDELRLSNWFEQGKFFDESPKGGHAYWVCSIHLPRLRKMFRIAGYDMQPRIDLEDPDDSWLADAISWLDSSERVNAPGYFASSQGGYLFQWAVSQLRLLVEAKKRCEFAKLECVVPHRNEGEGNCARHSEVFLNLKAVLCKTLANHGGRVRFGTRRLYCVIDAAAGDTSLVTPAWEERSFRACPHLEGKYLGDDDPTLRLGNFIYALRRFGVSSDMQTGFLERIRVDPSPIDAGLGLNISIEIITNLALGEFGSDCRQIHEALGELNSIACQPVKAGNKIHRFAFEVRQKGEMEVQFLPVGTRPQ